ncbi:hypothetical protein COV16_03460 [Candidatus Woesearchaeota archaeon CG10_big_fil_rev_8_21_14_0_10_34_8]|nr:MAG: hypothetical protein COV16_03460 [Candidatus Woesearchaeota archaeon CG10_big_fil_rev_8_21_14_0_10_34_8]
MTCKICSIAHKATEGKIVYEDKLCVAYLSEDAAVLGHIHIVPKEHIETLEDCDEELALQLFYVASYAATAVYEGLGSQGTNIICNNGKGAGSQDHLVIQVLSRKEGDNIELKWEAKQQSQADFEEVMSKIKDKADILESGVELTPEIESVEEEPDQTLTTEEENYQIKHLYKIP